MNISRISTIAAGLALIAAPLAPAVASAQTLDANVSADTQVQVAPVSVHANTTVGASTTLSHRMGRFASSSMRRERSATTTADREGKVVNKSDAEIDGRITALQQISARLAGEKMLPSGDRSTLQASIASEISALGSLKGQIGSDDSTTTLKADASSITKSYRIYALVIPQDKITSAADRVLAVASQMQQLSAKFATRISADSTVSSNVVSAKADFDAKVAAAQAQANSAVSAIAGLTPDNGDKTVMTSNTAALKDALQSIKNAQQDLVAARADANVIMKGIEGKKGADGSVSASTTARVNS